MLEYLVFAAAFAMLLATFIYIRSMFKGGAKPNRVTWFMWSMAPFIATAAAIYDGVGWAVLPVFMSGFSPFLIFTASFFSKKAHWQLSPYDYLCGSVSAIALILWYITGNPNLAITLAITSDAFAAIPTIIKAWNNPETESAWLFIISIFSSMTSFGAATTWSFSEYAFPTYLMALNIILVLSVYNKKLRAKI